MATAQVMAQGEVASNVKANKVSDDLARLLKKLSRAILTSRPLNIYQFSAAYLEAELDKRTLYELSSSAQSSGISQVSESLGAVTEAPVTAVTCQQELCQEVCSPLQATEAEGLSSEPNEWEILDEAEAASLKQQEYVTEEGETTPAIEAAVHASVTDAITHSQTEIAEIEVEEAIVPIIAGSNDSAPSQPAGENVTVSVDETDTSKTENIEERPQTTVPVIEITDKECQQDVCEAICICPEEFAAEAGVNDTCQEDVCDAVCVCTDEQNQDAEAMESDLPKEESPLMETQLTEEPCDMPAPTEPVNIPEDATATESSTCQEEATLEEQMIAAEEHAADVDVATQELPAVDAPLPAEESGLVVDTELPTSPEEAATIQEAVVAAENKQSEEPVLSDAENRTVADESARTEEAVPAADTVLPEMEETVLPTEAAPAIEAVPAEIGVSPELEEPTIVEESTADDTSNKEPQEATDEEQAAVGIVDSEPQEVTEVGESKTSEATSTMENVPIDHVNASEATALSEETRLADEPTVMETNLSAEDSFVAEAAVQEVVYAQDSGSVDENLDSTGASFAEEATCQDQPIDADISVEEPALDLETKASEEPEVVEKEQGTAEQSKTEEDASPIEPNGISQTANSTPTEEEALIEQAAEETPAGETSEIGYIGADTPAIVETSTSEPDDEGVIRTTTVEPTADVEVSPAPTSIEGDTADEPVTAIEAPETDTEQADEVVDEESTLKPIAGEESPETQTEQAGEEEDEKTTIVESEPMNESTESDIIPSQPKDDSVDESGPAEEPVAVAKSPETEAEQEEGEMIVNSTAMEPEPVNESTAVSKDNVKEKSDIALDGDEA